MTSKEIIDSHINQHYEYYRKQCRYQYNGRYLWEDLFQETYLKLLTIKPETIEFYNEIGKLNCIVINKIIIPKNTMRKLVIVAKPRVVLRFIANSGKSDPMIRSKAVRIQTNAYFSRNAFRLSNSKINTRVTSIVIAMVILSTIFSSFLSMNQR